MLRLEPGYNVTGGVKALSKITKVGKISIGTGGNVSLIELDAKTLASMRKERALGIWKRLVQYVQADLNEKDELQNFRILTLECMAWSGLIGVPEKQLGTEDHSVFRTMVAGGKKSRVVNTDPFKLFSDGLTPEEGAIKYQKDFIPVLKWLAGSSTAELGFEAMRFLWKHGEEGIGLRLELHGKRDESFYARRVEQFETIASPICRFILDKLDQYAVAEDKRDIVPVKLCAYCSNIMFFERSSKDTCGAACRVAKHRKGL